MRSGFATLVAVGMFALPSVVSNVAWAQDTFQPGPWQPLARVEPGQTVRVLIVNNSGATIEFDSFSTRAPLPQLQPTESAVVLLDTALPESINISTLSEPPFSEIPLNFVLSEESGNTLRVEVSIEFDSFAGDRVITIDDTGGVYVY